MSRQYQRYSIQYYACPVTRADAIQVLTAKSSYGPTVNCDASMLTFAALVFDATIVVLGGASDVEAAVGV